MNRRDILLSCGSVSTVAIAGCVDSMSESSDDDRNTDNSGENDKNNSENDKTNDSEPESLEFPLSIDEGEVTDDGINSYGMDISIKHKGNEDVFGAPVFVSFETISGDNDWTTYSLFWVYNISPGEERIYSYRIHKDETVGDTYIATGAYGFRYDYLLRTPRKGSTPNADVNVNPVVKSPEEWDILEQSRSEWDIVVKLPTQEIDESDVQQVSVDVSKDNIPYIESYNRIHTHTFIEPDATYLSIRDRSRQPVPYWLLEYDIEISGTTNSSSYTMSIERPDYNLEINSLGIGDSSNGLVIDSLHFTIEANNNSLFKSPRIIVVDNDGFVDFENTPRRTGRSIDAYPDVDEAGTHYISSDHDYNSPTLFDRKLTDNFVIPPSTSNEISGTSKQYTVEFDSPLIDLPVDENDSLSVYLASEWSIIDSQEIPITDHV